MKLLRSILFALAVLAALAAMAYGQYRIRLNADDSVATAIFLAASLAAAVLVGYGRTPAIGEPAEPASRGALARWAGGIGVLLGLGAIVAGSVLLCRGWHVWLAPGWALLIGGTALSSLGLCAFDPPRDRARAWSWAEIGAVAAVFGIGTFLRYHRYFEFPDPFGMHAIEEAQVGMRSYSILKHNVYGWEFIFDNLLGVLGIVLTGDRSFTAVRIPFTAASALTILPVYVILRQLTGVPAALGGAFLFAVSSWNIIYSRCAHAIFPVNLLVVIVVALMFHFARTRRLSVVPWAGFLSGVTLYSYAAYRGTTIFMLVLLGMLFVVDLRRRRERRALPGPQPAAGAAWRDVVAAVLLTGIVAAMFAPVVAATTSNMAQPMYYFEAANRSLANKEYYSSDPKVFLHHRLERMRAAARIFMHFGDGSTTFNLPGEPMLDPLTSVLFVGGLFLAICYARRDLNAFLVFLFLALMFGSTVFVQNLDVRRTQGVTPFVAVFAALFLDALWQRVRQLPRALLWIVVAAVAGAGAAFATYWNYDVYFEKMAGSPVVRQGFKNQYTILIHYGRLHPEENMHVLTDVHHFFEPSDYFWLVDELMKGSTLYDIDEVLPPYRFPENEGLHSVVVQNPYERESVARMLKAFYPGAECKEFIEPEYTFVSLTACKIPPGAAARPVVRTLQGRYWRGEGPVGEPHETRLEPFIGFSSTPSVCSRERPPAPETSCYAEWTGTFEVPADGDYQFAIRARERARLEASIDGKPLVPGMLHLTAGTHQFSAQARMQRANDAGVALDWRYGGETTLVPFYRVGTAAEAASPAATAEPPPPAAAEGAAPPPAPAEPAAGAGA